MCLAFSVNELFEDPMQGSIVLAQGDYALLTQSVTNQVCVWVSMHVCVCVPTVATCGYNKRMRGCAKSLSSSVRTISLSYKLHI